MNQFIVLGVARSGTSHIASLLGAHPDVNMVFENWYSGPFPRMCGKPFIGNKLSVPNQISWDRKFNFRDRRDFKTLSAVRHLMYKARLGFGMPRCPFSIRDLSEEVKFVIVRRDRCTTVKSWLQRAGNVSFPRFMDRKNYVYELYERGMHDLRLVEKYRRAVSVKYREGTGYTKNDMERVLAFLGLDYTDRIWQGQKFNPVYPFDGKRFSLIPK